VLRWFYKVHKWVGIGIGLILLMWVVTGVLLSTGKGEERPTRPPAADWGRVSVSPAQAAAVAASGDSALENVLDVGLDQVAGRVIYRVLGARNRAVLVDAETGQRITVDEALARSIAEHEVPGAPVLAVKLLTHFDRSYNNGMLPVWRVALADEQETIVYVTAREGRASSIDASRRSKQRVLGWHTFGALRSFSLGRGPIRTLLIVSSVIAMVSIVTGYVMSLPKGWWRRGA
jgi:uncharacterized iron-regulated membrane protein